MATIETFRTLNSTYEVDRENKLIRRLAGINPPTSNQGEDGNWQPYQRLWMQPTGCVLIVFDPTRATLTSRVRGEWIGDA